MLAELESLYPGPPALDTLHQPESRSNHTSESASDENVEYTPTVGLGPSIQDIYLFFGISVMLFWPWIFFGVVWATKGIEMNDHLAMVIISHPHTTTYFITLICTIISLIVGKLFSLAIIRFAQELVTHHQPTHPFHLTVLLAFRHQTWPWGKSLKDAKYLMTKNKWWPAALVMVCVLIFPHLTSSTATLLAPTLFNRTIILTGTELNFSSTDGVCLAWFNANPLSQMCGQQAYNRQGYTSCFGGGRTVDILEAGRSKVLESLTNNSESITFGQLGAGGGLHFQGSAQGVLPLGPNGVRAFNTSLEPSPLSNPEKVKGMIPYDYTLYLQGLTSNVICSYSPTYPFVFGAFDPGSNLGLQYNASCPSRGEADVLASVPSFSSAYSNNTLVYWACQSMLNGTLAPSYSIYLTGLGTYTSQIGNITCTVDLIQSATYPVTYRSTGNTFSTEESTTQPSPLAFSTPINNALIGLGSIILDAQSLESNLFAESVLDFGLEFFEAPAVLPPPRYLQLHERMIQGILEYEMTYLRWLYSTQITDAPSSCLRTVTGLLDHEVFGWFVTDANIGFLIPITFINLAALVALALAMTIANSDGYTIHFSHPRQVVYDEYIDQQEQIPDEWMYKVSVRPTTALKEYNNRDM